MINFICQSAGSQEDLEAFRLVGPWSGKFISLTAIKTGIPTETKIVFENLSLILHNLNLGFPGMGPGCLEQILVELGADKEAAMEAVQSRKKQLHVERWDKVRQRLEKDVAISRLGGDLVALESTVPYSSPD